MIIGKYNNVNNRGKYKNYREKILKLIKNTKKTNDVLLTLSDIKTS